MSQSQNSGNRFWINLSDATYDPNTKYKMFVRTITARLRSFSDSNLSASNYQGQFNNLLKNTSTKVMPDMVRALEKSAKQIEASQLTAPEEEE